VETLNFIRNRLLHMAPVLFGIVFIVFLMVRLIPGDPARIILGVHASPERVAELRTELGLNEPLWRQFVLFVGDVLRGDLGTSLVFRRPVMDVVMERLPATMFLIGYAAMLSLLITIPMALLAAINRGGWVDQTVRAVFTLSLSMPGFWLGLLFLLLFSVRLRLFPVSGYGDDFLDRLWHLFLPALTITLSLAPILIRNLRSGVIEVLDAPFVEFARAKGLRDRLILRRHVLRNALISTVTLLGLNIGYLMGGSVIIETVCTIRGLGSLIVDSIFARDYPLIQGIGLVFGILVILINLATDIVYALLDPRVAYD